MTSIQNLDPAIAQDPWQDGTFFSWLPGVDSQRQRIKSKLPKLLHRKKVPPFFRLLKVSLKIGIALGIWYITDRKKGTQRSRKGIARRLRITFESLGPTYIKLGQIISSGEGIFPEELVNEFSLLRDKVPPESFEVVKNSIESELGAKIEDLFQDFSQTSLAAASIAQVYKATLQDGQEVVVKVQRSNIASLVYKDLEVMSWLAPILIGRIPVAALANPPALVELFAETIVEELDFRVEAGNMIDVASVLLSTGQKALVVPKPHPTLVTKKILVMQRLDGFNWDDVEGMRLAGIDTKEVLHSALISFLEGLLLYGIFHGDLHAGNLFVQSDGKVALLDYGITGRLGEKGRLAFLRLVMGTTTNDVVMQVEGLRDLGALPHDVDIQAVINELGLDQPPQDIVQMSAQELTNEMKQLTKSLLGYGAKLPKELMLFVKNMLFLDGAIATFAPDIDLFAEVINIATYFLTNYSDRLTADIGLNSKDVNIDLNGIRGSLGLGEDVEELSYKDLQKRREIIRKRLEKNNSKN